jgi:hypothetical protein
MLVASGESTPFGGVHPFRYRDSSRHASVVRPRPSSSERRQLAADYAVGKLREAEFLSAAATIRDQEVEAPRASRPVDARSVVRRLRDFAGLWASRSEALQAEMLRTVYARVEVEGPKFVGAYLTPDALELVLTLALPESFAMARPAGDGHALANIPIVGWHEVDAPIRSA